MQNKVNIQTLTPVHIGSGNSFQSNMEYLYFPVKNQVAIIDENKVLAVIGKEHIDKWVSIIEKREDLLAYLKTRKSNLTINDVSKRIIALKDCTPGHNQTIKEQLHNGMAKPYIPGSSIKGAIRTAVFNYLLKQKNAAFIKEKGIEKYPKSRKYTDNNLMKALLGSDAKKDAFRFLRIDDVYFDKNTIGLRMQILNSCHNGWEIKSGGDQLIEALPAGIHGTLNVTIANKLLDKNKPFLRVDTSYLTFRQLCEIINKLTLRLVSDEIDFWDEENIKENILTPYLDNLLSIKSSIESCNDNEAVLRIGHSSGWPFMTGAWIKDERLMPDEREYYSIVHSIRKKVYHDDMPFPKTRKIVSNQQILGFVKISLIEQ